MFSERSPCILGQHISCSTARIYIASHYFQFNLCLHEVEYFETLKLTSLQESVVPSSVRCSASGARATLPTTRSSRSPILPPLARSLPNRGMHQRTDDGAVNAVAIFTIRVDTFLIIIFPAAFTCEEGRLRRALTKMGCTLKELSYDDGCCYVCQYESARKKVHNFVQGNITNHFRLLSSLMVCYRLELVPRAPAR